MAWRSTLQASRREVKSPSRSRRDRVTPSSERNKTDGTRTHTPRQLRFARRTARFTVTPSIFLSSGRYSSSTLEQASSDALVALSPSYLQRHSRHTPASSQRRSVCCTRERARVGDACRRSASINAGRWRPAVKLHGSIGQRHALLHDSRPLVHVWREGASASSESKQCFVHGALLVRCNANFREDLGCMQSCFGLGRSGQSRRFAPHPICATRLEFGLRLPELAASKTLASQPCARQAVDAN